MRTVQQRSHRGKALLGPLQERASGRASARGVIMESLRSMEPSRLVRGSSEQALDMWLWALRKRAVRHPGQEPQPRRMHAG